MTRATYQERLTQIKPLYEQGMSYTKIGKQIGMSSSGMSGLMRRALESGDLKVRKAPSLRHSNVRLGSLSQSLQGHSPEFIDWIIQETRGNLTVAELAVGAMLDAFHDEQEE